MKNYGNGLNLLDREPRHFTKNESALWAYLLQRPKHPQVLEHKAIAAHFEVYSYRNIFRLDALRRVLIETAKEPVTAATISKKTGLPHKYLCQLKRFLERKGLIRVVDFGRCPTTGSNRVQFLISNFQDPIAHVSKEVLEE
ncbi:MAG: hypothetical protein AAFX53_13170 [Bacteroidota bacterium]